MAFQKYDLDALTNTSGGENILVQYTQSVSQQTSYLPGILLLLSVFIVLFLSLKLRGATTPGAFAVTCFINMILAILFFGWSIIPGAWMMISLIMFPASLFLLYVMEGM